MGRFRAGRSVRPAGTAGLPYSVLVRALLLQCFACGCGRSLAAGAPRPQPGSRAGLDTASAGNGNADLPETLLRSRPPANSAACNARLTISSNAPVWGYESKLDEGPWTLGPKFTVQKTDTTVKLVGLIHQGTSARTASVVPHTVSGLRSGGHTLQVRAFDGAGRRDETPEVVHWTIQPVETILVTPPSSWTLPHSPMSFEVRSSAAKWAFEFRVDEGPWHLGSAYGLQGGKTPSPGSTYDRTEVTKHTDHTRAERQNVGSGGEGYHKLEVRAFNDCGEAGPSVVSTWKSSWVQTSVLRAPQNGTAVSDTDLEFVVEVGAARPSFQWSLDGDGWLSLAAKPQLSAGLMGVTVPLEGVSEGAHILFVRALDYQGRADFEGATYFWTVDTTPPATSLSLTDIPGRQSLSEAAFSLGCDDLTICRYRYRLDGGGWVDTESNFVRVGGLERGDHTMEVAAVDAAGNIDLTPVTHRWSVDMGLPVTAVALGPLPHTAETSAHFEFSVSREGCELQYSLDGGLFQPTTGLSLGLHGLLDGQHRLRVYSTDAFGRTEPSPAVYTWVVDTEPPETLVHQWFLSPDEQGVAVLSIGARATSAEVSSASARVFDYQFQVCGQEGCTDWALGQKTTRMGAGYQLRIDGLAREHEYLVRVRASDRAGNVDPTPAEISIHYGDDLDTDTTRPAGHESSASRSLQQDESNATNPPLRGSSWSPDGPTAGILQTLSMWISRSSTSQSQPTGGSSHMDLRRRMRREL